jgi:citrate synthase
MLIKYWICANVLENEEIEMTAEGLEGVVVAETRLSDVDGERGRLVVRGHDVEALAERADFEAACALLWTGELPGPVAHAEVRKELGRARVRAFARLPSLGDAFETADGMEALRAALAHLRASELADERLATELTAAVAVFAAAWARRQRGSSPIAPDPELGHAADYLRMASAHGSDPARSRALDAYLVTAMDHGMNASTFTARVVASTDSDTVSAIVAALGALKGPRHGGAPGPVLAMLDAIGEPGNAAAWIAAELAAGRRIMGMGHRVYRVRDPRAAVLERAVERLRATGLRSDRLDLARAVERVAVASLGERRPERRMAANVEFYTAVLLDAIGLPQELFSPTFAVARVAGWLAHVAEQRESSRIIRPSSHYVGPVPEAPAAA